MSLPKGKNFSRWIVLVCRDPLLVAVPRERILGLAFRNADLEITSVEQGKLISSTSMRNGRGAQRLLSSWGHCTRPEVPKYLQIRDDWVHDLTTKGIRTGLSHLAAKRVPCYKFWSGYDAPFRHSRWTRQLRRVAAHEGDH